jgi:hypothetical protein
MTLGVSCLLSRRRIPIAPPSVSGTDAEGLISLCAAPAVARPHLPPIGARRLAAEGGSPGAGGRQDPRREAPSLPAAIAAEINDKGISAPRGGRWSAPAVIRAEEKATAARM